MSAALWNLVTALLLALPFAPADVQAVGITVRESVQQAEMEARSPNATGWIGCSTTHCDVLISEAFNWYPFERAQSTRHEVCHGLDMLSDGAMDGAILGWQPWAGSEPAPGEPTDDVERLGYWCERQAVSTWPAR